MKVDIVYPKRAFDEQFDPTHAPPSELIRESVFESQLIERRQYDPQPIVLLLNAQTTEEFEEICGLIRRLHTVENAICRLSDHFYVIINGLTSFAETQKTNDEVTWQRQAEALYELGADEVHILPMDDSLMASRLRSLGGRMLERVRQQLAMVRYEEAQELGNIGSWHYDFVTNQCWWTNHQFEIFGRDPSLGAPKIDEFMSMLHPDDREAYHEEMKKTLYKGLPYQLEYRIIHKELGTRIISCWGKPIFNDEGVLVEKSGVVQDITERRQAENDLGHHEAALRFISDGAPAMMYSLRMDCDEALWVEYYSVGSLENFSHSVPDRGAELKPFVLKHFSQQVYDEILKQCHESARDLAPWSREFHMTDDFGELRCVSGRSMPARLDDGSIIWRGVFYDITEQKKVEEQLQMADRLASIGTLAAGMAHEINNPLSFVMSNLEYTLEEIQRNLICKDSSEVVLALESGLEGAQRISMIVKGLMTYARHSDDLDEVVDLEEAIQTAIRITHSQFRYNTELRLEIESKQVVVGNEGQLCQVFVNLILNALYAMPSDRQSENVITIRLVEQESDSVVCVEIEDNGVGIPSKTQKRLFDPFYSTRAIGQGPGLGLYVSRNMISAMGGRLELESASDSVTVFRVFLNRYVGDHQ